MLNVPLSQVSLEDACDPGTSIGTYSLLLHSYRGRTMLEFQVENLITAPHLQLMHTHITGRHVILMAVPDISRTPRPCDQSHG